MSSGAEYKEKIPCCPVCATRCTLFKRLSKLRFSPGELRSLIVQSHAAVCPVCLKRVETCKKRPERCKPRVLETRSSVYVPIS